MPLLFIAVLSAAAAFGRTKAGDRYLAEGRVHEAASEWEAAQASYQQALAEDPTDIQYRMAFTRAEFQNKQAAELAARKQAAPTDAQKQATQRQRRIASMQGVPVLAPLDAKPLSLTMSNQKPRILFETVCRLAGINLLIDPEYQEGKPQSISLENTSLEGALDSVALLTHSFWRPVNANTVFVTNDNPNKRRDYEPQVTKVFYLHNVNNAQELQEIVTTIRAVADLQRVFVYNSQSAIIARGEADRIALAEKVIADLDKPRAEVVVDILVMEASSVFSKKIATGIATSGLNVPVSFSPRSGLAVTTTSSSSSSSSSTTTTSLPLASLGHLSSADYTVVLPDGLLQAALSDANTKILQSPQLRSVDSQKASLRIGDRQPTASGSYTNGVTTTSTSALVSTTFTYIDVGVNVDLTPKVHDNGDVSMHVEVEISSVNGHVTLGDISQPIIGQRKVIHDIRIKEGEVSLMGGLVNQQETKTKTGVPGVSSIPVLGKLFSGDQVEKNRGELMIALIPHIVRRQEVNEDNLRGIDSGNGTSVKLNYDRQTDRP